MKLRALAALALALGLAPLVGAACGDRVSLGVEPAPDAGPPADAAPPRPSPSPGCLGRGCGAPCAPACAPDAGDCPPGHCDPEGVCHPGPETRCDGASKACGKGSCGQACSPCAPGASGCEPSPAYVCDAFGACLFGVAECPCKGPGCGGHGGTWQPCAGHLCGEPCHACPPDAVDCVEPPGDKACNGGGACMLVGDAACPPGDPCATRACGEPCGPCGVGAPGCTSGLPAACDLDRACRFGDTRCTDPCDGRPAGASCSLCPPDHPTCVEADGPKVCDATGRCVPAP